MDSYIDKKMQIKRSNTILYCKKWSETVAFYRDIFDFEMSFQNDWFVEFQITADSFLSVADESRATIDSVDGQGVTLAWQVEDIQTIRDKLIVKDVGVTEIKKRWGSLVVYLHDPENHRIELWQEVYK